jgi:hypothetical protein
MSIVNDTVKSARSYTEALSEAALASAKSGQELAGKAVSTWVSALGSTLRVSSPSDLPKTAQANLSAGFDLAQEALQTQRRIAEKLLAAASPAAG